MVSYDIMHSAAGCIQNLLGLVKGNTFGEGDATYEHTKNGRCSGIQLEKHPFIASKDGLKAARDWLIRAKECSGDTLYDVNIDSIFSDSWKRCHDYCVFASPFGKGAFSLLGLGKEQRTTAYMHFDAISHMQRKWFTSADIQFAPVLMAEALAYLEQDFPFVLQDIKNHNLMHIAEALKESGPAWVAAMWSFEIYNMVVANWAGKRPSLGSLWGRFFTVLSCTWCLPDLLLVIQIPCKKSLQKTLMFCRMLGSMTAELFLHTCLVCLGMASGSEAAKYSQRRGAM